MGNICEYDILIRENTCKYNKLNIFKCYELFLLKWIQEKCLVFEANIKLKLMYPKKIKKELQKIIILRKNKHLNLNEFIKISYLTKCLAACLVCLDYWIF